jgi:hypothetical protein
MQNDAGFAEQKLASGVPKVWTAIEWRQTFAF